MHRNTSAGARCSWSHVVALPMSGSLERLLYMHYVLRDLYHNLLLLNSLCLHSFKASLYHFCGSQIPQYLKPYKVVSSSVFRGKVTGSVSARHFRVRTGDVRVTVELRDEF